MTKQEKAAKSIIAKFEALKTEARKKGLPILFGTSDSEVVLYYHQDYGCVLLDKSFSRFLK